MRVPVRPLAILMAIPGVVAQLASQGWEKVAPPAARALHGIGFDPARGQLVLGGQDTWVVEGGEWRHQPSAGGAAGTLLYHAAVGDMLAVDGNGVSELTATGWVFRAVHPAPRSAAGVAHDSVRNVTVVFGGGDFIFGQPYHYGLGTWEYDGTSWTQAAVQDPPTRERPAMAFDALRGVVVMFGGRDTAGPGNLLAETWEYDGVAWTLRSPLHAPSGREAAAMAFDPLGGRTVLFGGFDTQRRNDTWEYDGVDWTQRATVTAPSPRADHAMTFDPQRGQIALNGGNTDPNAGEAAETWALAPAGWARIGRSQLPDRRIFTAMAHHAASGKTVLLDGDNVAPTNEYFVYTDAAGWQNLSAQPHPPGRYGHRMVYDERRQRLVTFSGFGNGFNTATWEHDGNSWTSVATATAPTARAWYGMAYDSFRDRVALFGGDNGFAQLSDTWEYDGQNWTRRFPTGSPSARKRFGMTFDGRRGVSVLFGGLGGSSDTWEYDGARWIQVATPTAPAQTHDVALCWDRNRGRVVLFGGESQFTTRMWQYDGVAWSSIAASPMATARAGHELAADDRRDRLVLHGGIATASIETWEFVAAPVAVWSGIGPACGPAPAPVLAAAAGSTPALGSTFTLLVGNLPATAGAAIASLGVGTDLWFGQPLPFDLGVFGIPCRASVPADSLLLMALAPGISASISFQVPASPLLDGLQFFNQAVVLTTTGGSLVTNGGVGVVH